MKNNTKLIMETWRRFLNEDSSDPDLDTGFSNDDDSRPSRDPGSLYDEASQGIGDTTLDLIRQCAPEQLIQYQAEIEGLSPEEVLHLRAQFAKENEDAFKDRYGDEPDDVYDPDGSEVYYPDSEF